MKIGAPALQAHPQTVLPQGPSWRTVALVGAAVLAVHVLLLSSAALKLGSEREAAAGASQPVARVFSTRRIERPAVALPEPVPAVQPPPAQPKKTPPAPPRKVAKAKPTPTPASLPPASELPLEAGPPVATETGQIEPNSAMAQSGQGVEAIDSGAIITPKPDAEPAATAAVPPAAPAVADPLAPTTIASVKLADSVLLRYTMRGSAKGLDYHANAELSWRNLGAEYEASMRVSAFFLGSRTMSSRGQITPGGLAPTRFSDKSRSEQAAHFDSSKGRITFSANTPDAPLLAGAQDRVSVFFQLAGILAAGPGNQTGATALPLGTQITIYTVGPREADTWTFVVEGEELLTLPAGEMVTLKLTRTPRRQYDQTVEIWYAPSQAFMPVRSRITQANGDFIDQQLKAVEAP